MISNSSAFDEALSRPFLDEPTKKKWSVSKLSNWLSPLKQRRNSNMSSTTSLTSLSSYDSTNIEGGGGSISLESDIEDDDDNNSYDCEIACLLPPSTTTTTTTTTTKKLQNEEGEVSTTTKEVVITDKGEVNDDNKMNMSDDDNTNPGKRTSTSSSSNGSINTYMTPTLEHPLDDIQFTAMEEVILTKDIEHNTLALDLAILREREEEFVQIKTSMNQIHNIQQDIAMVVESQESDIVQMSMNSIEAFQHTESGLEHLVKEVRHKEDRKSRLYSFIVSAAIVMGVCYMVATFFSTEEDPASEIMPIPGGDYTSHGAPKFQFSSSRLP